MDSSLKRSGTRGLASKAGRKERWLTWKATTCFFFESRDFESPIDERACRVNLGEALTPWVSMESS